MDTLIIRGKYIITNVKMKEAGILTDRAIYVTDGKIAEIGAYQQLKEKYPGATVKGDGNQLLMPGLIDAHSHGSGISYFQQGIPYDFLENNFFDWNFGVVTKKGGKRFDFINLRQLSHLMLLTRIQDGGAREARFSYNNSKKNQEQHCKV